MQWLKKLKGSILTISSCLTLLTALRTNSLVEFNKHLLNVYFIPEIIVGLEIYQQIIDDYKLAFSVSTRSLGQRM